MDSLTHVALGAAIGVAVMGRRTKIWKAALWGSVCNTLPDLDVLIDRGDPISNMTMHRAESHSLFYLTLISPLVGWLIARINGEMHQVRHWLLLAFLALATHPLLDLLTMYGTQIGLPFSKDVYAIGSLFIIDPLYTLPLLIGVIAALSLRDSRGLRWNGIGLALSTMYLAWSLVAQHFVLGVARDSLQARGIQTHRIQATPTAFNTILWRVIALTDQGYVEGFYSLLDDERLIVFDEFARGNALREALRDARHVNRLDWFTRGFFKMTESDGQVLMSDVRLGQEPYYNFTFIVAERRNGRLVELPPEFDFQGRNAQPLLAWLRKRIGGNPVPPPRGP